MYQPNTVINSQCLRHRASEISYDEPNIWVDVIDNDLWGRAIARIFNLSGVKVDHVRGAELEIQFTYSGFGEMTGAPLLLSGYQY